MVVEDDRLVDAKEAARVLHLKPATVRRQRLLPAVRIGRRAIRFRWSDVQRLVHASGCTPQGR
jgi:hypothetical protein